MHVIFEQEGIDTRNPGIFFQPSLAASVAQCESETISENMKWVYNNRVEQGIFIAPKRKYFGYNTDDGNFTPDENAKYVRMIFERFEYRRTGTDGACKRVMGEGMPGVWLLMWLCSRFLFTWILVCGIFSLDEEMFSSI